MKKKSVLFTLLGILVIAVLITSCAPKKSEEQLALEAKIIELQSELEALNKGEALPAAERAARLTQLAAELDSARTGLNAVTDETRSGSRGGAQGSSGNRRQQQGASGTETEVVDLPQIPEQVVGSAPWGVVTLSDPISIRYLHLQMRNFEIVDGKTLTVNVTMAGIYSDMNIPSHIEGLPVTAVKRVILGGGGYRNPTTQWTLTIPSTVILIDEEAFRGNGSLGRVIFTPPSSLTTIGQSAFAYAGFSSFDIPPTVTRIGHHAFFNSGLTGTVNIPPSVTYIGERAFGATNIREVTISRRTQLGENVFPSNAQINYRD
ncbi:MAG: leucine-rich repeat protein [Treponema sp.]|nr:leucine-rich repeat protein [Treponema sp.]